MKTHILAFLVLIAAIVALPQHAFAQHPEHPIHIAEQTTAVEDEGLPRLRGFLELELEFMPHTRHVGTIITAEVALRLTRRLSIGPFGLAFFAPDGTHFGGGLSVRFETSVTELLFRVALNHRLSEFPDNIIRVEVQYTRWLHPNFGGVVRGLLENFPAPLNDENRGRWDTVLGAGVSYRPNSYFTSILLATSRWADLSHVRPTADHDAELAIMLMAEGIFPLLE